MDKDTDIGGHRGRFPATRHSVLQGVGSADSQVRRRAFETLVDAYWKPVYKYVRIKWGEGNEDAKDLTQDFFALALEKGFFERYEPSRARFRTYLRTCLDGFVSNQRKAAKRLKRGGGTESLSLDFEDAEGELRPYEIPDGLDMEEYFHREWMRHLFGLADPPDPRLHPDADPADRFRPHLKKARGTLNRRASTALNVGREERP